MFPNPYNFVAPPTYPLQYNPWATAQAQAAQIRAAQLQLQQAYNLNTVQPTLITSQLQQQQTQQVAAAQLQAVLQQQQNNNLITQQQQNYQQRIKTLHQHQQKQRHNTNHNMNNHKHKRRHNNNNNNNNSHHLNNNNKDKKINNHNRINPNDLFPRTCDKCNIICNSLLQWEMHLKGKKHIKQTRSYNNNQNINTSSDILFCFDISFIHCQFPRYTQYLIYFLFKHVKLRICEFVSISLPFVLYTFLSFFLSLHFSLYCLFLYICCLYLIC